MHKQYVNHSVSVLNFVLKNQFNISINVECIIQQKFGMFITQLAMFTESVV